MLDSIFEHVKLYLWCQILTKFDVNQIYLVDNLAFSLCTVVPLPESIHYRSTCSQMILHFTSQSESAMNQTLTHCSKTSSPYKHGNTCGILILIQVSVGLYTSQNPSIQPVFMLHGQALKAADHARYLGVDISKDLSLKTHINRITANANRILGILNRKIKPQHTGIRTAAYSALVHPQVEYASPV